MLSALNNFYLSKEEPLKSCFLALKDVLLSYNPEFTEEWKYKAPFFCLKGKNVCYLWYDKKSGHPYIGIVKGGLVNHKALVKGDRKTMKVLPINPEQDIPVESIYEVLDLVMGYY